MSSLRNAFAVLEAVLSQQSGGTLFSQVCAATGLPKATVHRLLKELTELGYLNYCAETRRYRGALKLAGLGAGVMENLDIRTHAHPFLLELQKASGHTCNTGVKSNDVGVYVDKIESRDPGIKLYSEIGKSFPLYCTGLGKVLLAWSPAREVDRILALHPLEPVTEHTITTPDALRQELAQIREQGYALDREEITRGIMCVAAPVFGPGGPDARGGEPVCAISATFPSYVYTDRGIESEIALTVQTAARISGLSD